MAILFAGGRHQRYRADTGIHCDCAGVRRLRRGDFQAEHGFHGRLGCADFAGTRFETAFARILIDGAGSTLDYGVMKLKIVDARV